VEEGSPRGRRGRGSWGGLGKEGPHKSAVRDVMALGQDFRAAGEKGDMPIPEGVRGRA
jgi:hypothetical protein